MVNDVPDPAFPWVVLLDASVPGGVPFPPPQLLAVASRRDMPFWNRHHRVHMRKPAVRLPANRECNQDMALQVSGQHVAVVPKLLVETLRRRVVPEREAQEPRPATAGLTLLVPELLRVLSNVLDPRTSKARGSLAPRATERSAAGRGRHVPVFAWGRARGQGTYCSEDNPPPFAPPRVRAHHIALDSRDVTTGAASLGSARRPVRTARSRGDGPARTAGARGALCHDRARGSAFRRGPRKRLHQRDQLLEDSSGCTRQLSLLQRQGRAAVSRRGCRGA